MVISEDPWHSRLMPRVWQWSSLSRPWFEHLTFRLRGERYNPLRLRRGCTHLIKKCGTPQSPVVCVPWGFLQCPLLTAMKAPSGDNAKTNKVVSCHNRIGNYPEFKLKSSVRANITAPSPPFRDVFTRGKCSLAKQKQIVNQSCHECSVFNFSTI